MTGAFSGIAQVIGNKLSSITGGGGGRHSGGGGPAKSTYVYDPNAKIGDAIATFESGTEGVKKIGHDGTGGTSYGKWQLSSTTAKGGEGSMQAYLRWMRKQGGEKKVMQRGAGICTVKSTPEREKACVAFLKWLTDSQKNVEFVARLGYMPVKQKSFDLYLEDAIDNLTDPMYVTLYKTFQQTQEQYEFYVPPQLDAYLDLETRFEQNVRLAMKYGRAKYLEDSPDLLGAQVWDTLDYFKEHY